MRLKALLLALMVAVGAYGYMIVPDRVETHNTIVYTQPPAEITLVANVQKMYDTTVYLETARGSCGSGVLFTKGNISFVWTAAHTLRSDPDDLNSQPVAVKVYQLLYDGRGNVLTQLESDAKVLAYSAEYDVALLELEQRNFSHASVTFYEGDIPPVGTGVYHVGHYFGPEDEWSFSAGVIAHIGRVNKVQRLVDQTNATVFPGSSGGGMFLSSGRVVGIVSSMSHPNCNYMVPVRTLWAWAEQIGITWAMRHDLPTPAERPEYAPTIETGPTLPEMSELPTTNP